MVALKHFVKECIVSIELISIDFEVLRHFG